HATYDAAGDMTCRALSGFACGGNHAQSLSYSNERMLAHWQNTPSSPTLQDDFLYDGSGQRMEQSVNTSGTTTATTYLLGGVEEVTGGTITTYLGVAGLPSAVRVGSTLSYLITDGLGSVSEAFDTNGNETAAQLYTPYGQTRYTTGVMPTSKGFTSDGHAAYSELVLPEGSQHIVSICKEETHTIENLTANLRTSLKRLAPLSLFQPLAAFRRGLSRQPKHQIPLGSCQIECERTRVDLRLRGMRDTWP
ncbi:MAG TPA: hypothetical protein VKQ36_05855, partial [Ktedonobacterales bacterium]|nr:hypothetical protein [Ktedonobacterales bacterium]